MSKNKTIFTALLVTAIAASTSIGVLAKDKNYAEKAAAFESSISATQAVQSAVEKTGGQATEVDFKFKNGESFYIVETVKDGQETDVKIDAKSGAVISSRADGTNNLPAAKLSLTDAIAKAEAQTGGKTKEAELKNKGGQIYYEVDTVMKNQKNELKIDANSGAVLETQTHTKTVNTPVAQ